MNRHAKLMGWSTDWPPDDYVVLDKGRSVGRIYKTTIQRAEVALVDQHQPIPRATAAQRLCLDTRCCQTGIQGALRRNEEGGCEAV
jgi:hypothetical protein